MGSCRSCASGPSGASCRTWRKSDRAISNHDHHRLFNSDRRVNAHPGFELRAKCPRLAVPCPARCRDGGKGQICQGAKAILQSVEFVYAFGEGALPIDTLVTLLIRWRGLKRCARFHCSHLGKQGKHANTTTSLEPKT